MKDVEIAACLEYVNDPYEFETWERSMMRKLLELVEWKSQLKSGLED